LTNCKKRILYHLVFFTLALFSLAGCASAPTRGGSGPEIANGVIYINSSEGHVFALTPQNRKDKATFPATGEWVFPSVEGRLGFMYGPPVIDGANLYFGTFDGKVYALDASTGQKLWDVPFSKQEGIAGSPAVNKQSLFVAAGRNVYALDKLTGKKLWANPFQAEDRIWSNIVLSGDTLYFGSMDHRVYAVNIGTGQLQWPPFETQGAIASTPLIVGDTLYIGSFDKGFYAIDTATGKPRWSAPFQGESWFWERAIEYKGRIYVGNMDGKVYALDAKSGKTVWSSPFEAPSAIRSAPVVVDGVLIIASTNGKINGLDAETGKAKWVAPYPVGSEDKEDQVVADIAASGDTVYVHASNGILYMLEAATGRPLLTFPVKYTPKK